MNAIPYDRPEEDWEGYEEEPAADERLPGRPRRQWWGRGTAALLALVLCATGFYAGVRVEKSQLSSSTTTAGAGSAFASSAAGGARAGAAGTRAGASGASGAAGGRAGLASLFGGGSTSGGSAGAGAALGGGSSAFGTVTSIDGDNLYIADTSGNTVKVTLSSASKISKSVGVGKSAIRPGDTVVVRGLKDSSGAVSATSVTDSGASAAGFGAGSGSGSSSASSSSPSSAVSSLFGGSGG